MDKFKLKEKIGLNSTIIQREGKSIMVIDLNTLFPLIDQLDEPEKVVVPAFVDRWIKHRKRNMESVYRAISYLTSYGYDDGDEGKVYMWLPENTETFVLAWNHGYTVEKEEKYRVELPDPEKNSNTSNTVVLMRTKDGRVVINKINAKRFYEKEETKLTEEEIKRSHEYLWAFAEEVSE